MRPAFKTLLLLLFLHLFLGPRKCQGILPDYDDSMLSDYDFQDIWNVQECMIPFKNKYLILKNTVLRCCRVNTFNLQCRSPNAILVLVLEEGRIDSKCVYMETIQVKDLQLGFHKPLQTQCLSVIWTNPKTWNPFRRRANILRSLQLDPDLERLLTAAHETDQRNDIYERLWEAVKDLRFYKLRSIEMRSRAAEAFFNAAVADDRSASLASAFASPAGPTTTATAPTLSPNLAHVERSFWKDTLYLVEEFVIRDARLGDTLRLPSLPELSVLRVERCQLRSITSVESLLLTKLHVPGNRLRALPPTALNPRLLELNASNNPDLEVSATDLTALPSLNILDLSGVPSVGKLLAREPFPGLRAFRLTLDDCGVKSFAPGEPPFARLPHLTQLSLRNNNLTEWPRSATRLDRGVQKIQRLDLSNNSLTHIPPGGIQAVEILVADNAISQWSVDTFSPHIVIHLDLRRNSVKTIQGDMLEALERLWSLRSLLLEDNPLSCEPCELRSFVRWLNVQFQLKKKDVMKLTCQDGELRHILMERNVECIGAAWILEFLIPLSAFVLLVAVFFAIWLRWHKQLEFWTNSSGLRLFCLILPTAHCRPR